MVMIASPVWCSGSFTTSNPKLTVQTIIQSTSGGNVLVCDPTMGNSFTTNSNCWVDIIIIETSTASNI